MTVKILLVCLAKMNRIKTKERTFKTKKNKKIPPVSKDTHCNMNTN